MLTGILFAMLRTAAAFLLLLAVTRLMGRKTISQMTFIDFGVAITMGSVTANIAFGGDSSFHAAVTALLTFGFLDILTGHFLTKSFRGRKLVNSEPLILISNNQIVMENMKRARITLTELTSLLREKNAFNIADVNYAILENNGKLSVLFKSAKGPAAPADLQIYPPEKGLTKDMIIDGKILHENLDSANLTVQWLLNELKSKEINDVKEVFFAALDSSGGLYVSKGIQSEEKPGQHGIE